MNIIPPTEVTFVKNGLVEHTHIVAVIKHTDKQLIVCARTPFHPVDHIWPDQPADKGEIAIDGEIFKVTNCLVITQSQADLHFEVGSDITAKRFDEGWNYLVGHEVDTGRQVDKLIGHEVTLRVLPEYRDALNLGHSACHLSALALNKAMAEFWKRDVSLDSLGNPNFDQLAISDSRVTEFRSRDEYRIGKSLKRKQGFKAAEAFEQLARIEESINQQLQRWLETEENIHIEADGPLLNNTKRWLCRLDGQNAEIFCGGSHAASLKDYASIKVELLLAEDQSTLTMHTTATPPSD